MSALDEFINGAKKCLDTATIKTNEFIEASRVQIEKSQLTGQLREEYAKLGRLYYEMSTTGVDKTEKINTVISKINDLLADIQLAKETLSANIDKVCKNCGASNSSKFEYCSKCGMKLD